LSHAIHSLSYAPGVGPATVIGADQTTPSTERLTAIVVTNAGPGLGETPAPSPSVATSHTPCAAS